MALDLEEQEQLDELKAWWKLHGTRVIVAATVIVLVVGGARLWQVWSARQAAESSMLFDRAMQGATLNDAKVIKESSAQIMENYARSAYAAPAAWLAGKHNFEAGDAKSAEAQYQYAVEHAKDEGLKQLAKLRLAAVMFDQKRYDDALTQLDGTPAESFAGLYANLKGDILAAQGKADAAREAYKVAVAKVGEKSSLKPLIEIKLDGLGG